MDWRNRSGVIALITMVLLACPGYGNSPGDIVEPNKPSLSAEAGRQKAEKAQKKKLELLQKQHKHKSR